jgi:hypothetical protein
MDGTCRFYAVVTYAALISFAFAASAQQVTVTTPMVGVSDGFHQNIGVGFGFGLPGGGFFNNGGLVGIPAGVAGLRIGGPNGFLNIVADQGSSRSMTMAAPGVTVMNGGTGAIYDVTIRPFVIGFTPVVGGLGFGNPGPPQFGPMPIATIDGPSVLEDRLARLQAEGGLHGLTASATVGNCPITETPPADPLAAKLAAARESTAGQPSQSIVAIRRQQAEQDAAHARELTELLDRARRAEAAKNVGQARIYYQQALSRASGPQRAEIEAALRSLGSTAKSR